MRFASTVVLVALLATGLAATAPASAGGNQAQADGRFFSAPGVHFTVLFEGPADEQLANRAVQVLESAYWRIGTLLLTYPDGVVTVVLHTEEEFRDITRSPQWAAAAFDGRIRVPVRGALNEPAELERVLTHEYTHALIQSISPRNVPTWLHEGLAVVCEPNGAAWLEAQPRATGERLPLTRLANGFASLSGAQARQAYVDSGVAVQAMIDQFGAATVVGLLQDLARGDRLGAAFERRTAIPLDTFLARLDETR
jgi:hypothetical protein